MYQPPVPPPFLSAFMLNLPDRSRTCFIYPEKLLLGLLCSAVVCSRSLALTRIAFNESDPKNDERVKMHDERVLIDCIDLKKDDSF